MKRSVLIALVVVTACLWGILRSLITIKYFGGSMATYTSIDDHQKLLLANYESDTAYRVPEGLDFLETARLVTPSIVHIRTSYGTGDFSMNPLQFYFDKPARSSGSGVIAPKS